MSNLDKIDYFSAKIPDGGNFYDEKIFSVPEDFIKSCKDHPLIKSLYLTDAGYFPKAYFHSMNRPSGANETILLYCSDGKGYVELNSKKIEMTTGSVVCIPEKQPHKYYADTDNPWSLFWLHFKGLECKFYPLEENFPLKIEQQNANNRIQFYFIRLFDILSYNKSLYNYICLSNVLRVILSAIYFVEKDERISHEKDLFLLATNYMQQKLQSNISLDELAMYMHIAKSTVVLVFKKESNLSPIDYYINMKISTACKYLRLTHQPIYLIAQSVGYSDQYYFSRIFKKKTGCSPREYRKKQNNANLFSFM